MERSIGLHIGVAEAVEAGVGEGIIDDLHGDAATTTGSSIGGAVPGSASLITSESNPKFDRVYAAASSLVYCDYDASDVEQDYKRSSTIRHSGTGNYSSPVVFGLKAPRDGDGASNA